MKPEINALTLEQLRSEEALREEPAFRAVQIFRRLHKNGASSFAEMTELPLSLRERLETTYNLFLPRVVKKQVSRKDGTVKYLFELRDGACVETVLMRYHHGVSACLSTQVGCKMGCSFCASCLNGWERNLSAAEILGQMQSAERDSGLKIDTIVLMGIGEPLDNYDNVLDFLSILSHKEGRGMSLRNLSLSTCGIVPRIEELKLRKLPLTLSISLHAPNDAIRDRIMPINHRYPMSVLIPAVKQYANYTGRRVSYEYAMIRGVNDSDGAARELCALLRGSLCHVNLIPINPVEGKPWQGSSRERMQSFVKILSSQGITATIRRTLGEDVDAACGQLRMKTQLEQGR